MASIGDRLRSFWTSQGVKVRSGVSTRDIEGFEARYGVAFPDDFRGYLSVVDGMDPNDIDEELYWFMPLDDIKSVPESFAEDGEVPACYRDCINSLDPPGSYFVIVDYMISSHLYAIHLSSDPGHAGPVIWIDGGRWFEIAPSLA